MWTLILLCVGSFPLLRLAPKKTCFTLLSLLLALWVSLTPLHLNQGPEVILGPFHLDFYSFLMVSLSLITQTLVLLIASSHHTDKYTSIASILWALFFFLALTFSAAAVLEFYIYFEASLFPIFSLILLWGYQPERFKASLMLLFYTSIASLPLLLLILSSSFSSFYLSAVFTKTSVSSLLSSIFQLLFLLAVLIKIPIFGPHQWLPKAHVEAPVEGSMVLAAVLLKLGGYGLLRLLPMSGAFTPLGLAIGSVSLIGSSLISVVCLYQFDLKVLIAYSSVAHMSLVIAPLLILSSWGSSASLVVMVAHGASSSLLFALAHLHYKVSGSRSILFNKGVLLTLPLLTVSMFLACCANMAAPLTFNLLGELLAAIALFKSSTVCLLPFGLMMFLAAGYSLGLYSLTQHGKAPWVAHSSSLLSKGDLSLVLLHLHYASSLCLAFTLFT